jgi:hypothetical protein
LVVGKDAGDVSAQEARLVVREVSTLKTLLDRVTGKDITDAIQSDWLDIRVTNR